MGPQRHRRKGCAGKGPNPRSQAHSPRQGRILPLRIKTCEGEDPAYNRSWKDGEDEARDCGFTFTVLGERKEETTAEDTREVVKRIRDVGADLLVFCGGDGTEISQSKRAMQIVSGLAEAWLKDKVPMDVVIKKFASYVP